jgi:hypothetical protein
MSGADEVSSTNFCLTPGAHLLVFDDALFYSDVNDVCNTRYAVYEQGQYVVNFQYFMLKVLVI